MGKNGGSWTPGGSRMATNINRRRKIVPDIRTTRQSNSQNFIPPQTIRNVYQRLFFPRTVSIWNSLPTAVVTALNLDTFKSARCQCSVPRVLMSSGLEVEKF
ncbi:hypothetical protein DPMN_043299 [Dreissena polymorpha]|uniref:Uncharacterized protein n=1 Tax=Dreissena polymorpha TaxID=45954 RepID=A0A9D4D070_DREPO|nr:hypothetical protein DPMN_043299 [Dreissena polymorpha]